LTAFGGPFIVGLSKHIRAVQPLLSGSGDKDRTHQDRDAGSSSLGNRGFRVALLKEARFSSKMLDPSRPHCVKGVDTLVVYHPSQAYEQVSRDNRARCDDRDLAILDHHIPAHEYFQMDRSNHVVSNGDEVAAAGYPSYGLGDKINVPGRLWP
jgi:hypothetical protein